MNSISASSISQWDSGVLVFMLVSKLLVDISCTNCDLLYHISCTYIIAKYGDINTNGYRASFLDHSVAVCVYEAVVQRIPTAWLV